MRRVARPEPGRREVLVRLRAAALNHRDLFIRRRQYPAISFERALLADGCGFVEQVGADVGARHLLGRLVVLAPMRGWASDPAGPGPGFAVLGAAQDYVAVHEDDVEPAPAHLAAAEAAALPLAGLTAWRALVTKAGRPRSLLITGVGGGVALQALQFAVAMGCRAWVSSGDPAKLHRARRLGAAGGVLYTDDDWERRLRAMLPPDRPFLDAIVDGARARVVASAVRLLRPGGVIVQYGMTTLPRTDWLMQAVLANIELKGTTMGSRREFADMVAFVREHELRPVICRTVRGLGDLDTIDGLFADMAAGRQFGKLVIEIDQQETPSSL